MKFSRIVWLHLLALSSVVGIILTIHNDSDSSSLTAVGEIWLQPQQSDQYYPHPISSKEWGFSYTEIEHLLNRVHFDRNGEPSINRDLTKLYHKAYLALPENLTTESRQRLRLLIKKQFSESFECSIPQCKSVADLFIQYYLYQEELNNTVNQTARSLSPEQELDLLNKESELQRQYFGQITANRLFGRELQLKKYLTQRKIVKMSDYLSISEKREKLRSLEIQFEGNQ